MAYIHNGQVKQWTKADFEELDRNSMRIMDALAARAKADAQQDAQQDATPAEHVYAHPTKNGDVASAWGFIKFSLGQLKKLCMQSPLLQ